MISIGHNSSNLVWLRLDLRLTDNQALAAARSFPFSFTHPKRNRRGCPAVLLAGGCTNHCVSLTPDYANAARGW
jgi:nicotinamidase-related amidase